MTMPNCKTVTIPGGGNGNDNGGNDNDGGSEPSRKRSALILAGAAGVGAFILSRGSDK